MEMQGKDGTQVRMSRPLSCESGAVPVGLCLSWVYPGE